MDKVKRQYKKQKTIDTMLPKATGDAELDRLIKDRVSKNSNVARCRMNYTGALNKHAMDITFKSILKDKENHNIHGRQNVLRGIGTSKIERLISAGILSAKDLLEADPTDYMANGLRELIPRWQCKVEQHYTVLANQAALYKDELDAAEEEYKDASDELIRYKDSDAAKSIQRQLAIRRSNPYHSSNRKRPSSSRMAVAPHVEDEVDDPDWRPPLFSAFDDKSGYNGRHLSKYKIDCIVTSVFNHHRKSESFHASQDDGYMRFFYSKSISTTSLLQRYGYGQSKARASVPFK